MGAIIETDSAAQQKQFTVRELAGHGYFRQRELEFSEHRRREVECARASAITFQRDAVHRVVAHDSQ